MEFQASKFNTLTDAQPLLDSLTAYVKANFGTHCQDFGYMLGLDNTVLVIPDRRLVNYDFSGYTPTMISRSDPNYFYPPQN